jgi:hypothetical protein
MRLVLCSLLVACACSSSKPAPPAPTPSAPAAAPVAAAPVAAAPPKRTPAERGELQAKGLAAYERKEWASCGAMLDGAEDWYNAACCHALGGQPDPAFASLQRAIDGGFRDGKHLARDTDLASLHGDPRWTAAVAAVEAKHAAYRARLNGELADLYDADQADRAMPYDKIDWKVVNPRDEARRRRVDEIVAAGGAKVADDYYHAAMVYQHGTTPAEIQRAHELAVKAVGLDGAHGSAKWLAAASADRALMYEKKPQKYGTQYQKQNGTWVLWEVDPATTDEERARWNVPPLAAAKARAVQMNARKP